MYLLISKRGIDLLFMKRVLYISYAPNFSFISKGKLKVVKAKTNDKICLESKRNRNKNTITKA